MNVTGGSAADKAGLRSTTIDRRGQIQLGDIIVSIDGKKTPTTERLLDVLDQFEIGDTVTVTVLRDGDEMEFSVTLQER